MVIGSRNISAIGSHNILYQADRGVSFSCRASIGGGVDGIQLYNSCISLFADNILTH